MEVVSCQDASQCTFATAQPLHSCGAFLSSGVFRSAAAIRRYERAKVPTGTLGAAFRERRWSRGLEQWEAAEEIGVSTATYRNWGVNRSVPALKHIPAAIQFLGFDWRETGESLGARIRHFRTTGGLSIRDFAAALELDPCGARNASADRSRKSLAGNPFIRVTPIRANERSSDAKDCLRLVFLRAVSGVSGGTGPANESSDLQLRTEDGAAGS